MKNTILTLFFLFFLGILNAQKLITPIESQSGLFNEEERKAFEEFSKNDFVKDVKTVRFANIREAITDGYISFSLPENEQEIRMKVINSEFQDENNFEYSAEEQEDGEANGGYLNLNNTGGYISGSIQLASDFYRIFPISPECQVIISFNKDLEATCGTEISSKQPEAAAECVMGKTGCTTNVLILYSQKALTELPAGYSTTASSLLSFGNSLISQMNTAMKNSKITHKVTLAGIETIPDASFTGTAEQELDKYSVLLAISSTKTAQLMRIKKADLVVFLTKGEKYNDVAGKAYGLATSTDKPLAVVKMSYALARMTFAHEVGHLFGADHGKNDPQPGQSPARGYYLDASIGTMMTYASNRIQYFSNPDVKYNKKATGTKDDFNACIIQKNGCAVSQIMK